MSCVRYWLFFQNSQILFHEVFPINECLEHWRVIIPAVYSTIKQIWTIMTSSTSIQTSYKVAATLSTVQRVALDLPIRLHTRMDSALLQRQSFVDNIWKPSDVIALAIIEVKINDKKMTWSMVYLISWSDVHFAQNPQKSTDRQFFIQNYRTLNQTHNKVTWICVMSAASTYFLPYFIPYNDVVAI